VQPPTSSCRLATSLDCMTESVWKRASYQAPQGNETTGMLWLSEASRDRVSTNHLVCRFTMATGNASRYLGVETVVREC
jgi:hypothetical protein